MTEMEFQNNFNKNNRTQINILDQSSTEMNKIDRRETQFGKGGQDDHDEFARLEEESKDTRDQMLNDFDGQSIMEQSIMIQHNEFPSTSKKLEFIPKPADISMQVKRKYTQITSTGRDSEALNKKHTIEIEGDIMFDDMSSMNT